MYTQLMRKFTKLWAFAQVQQKDIYNDKVELFRNFLFVVLANRTPYFIYDLPSFN